MAGLSHALHYDPDTVDTEMTELNRYWNAGKVRKHLCLRWWGSRYQLRNLPRYLWLWLCGRYWRKWPVTVALYHHVRSQDQCYCPQGCQTYFRVEFFGLGSWGWLSRDWTPRPCHCDKIIWLLFPKDYDCEIEEYGAEKLRAEFPDVKAIGAA